MKILFLDHDGVMATVTEFGSRTQKQKNYVKASLTDKYPVHIRFDDFNKKCVQCLNEIIEETDCEIVVTSDWRKFATLEELQTLYELYGVKKVPIAVTELFCNIESKSSKRRGCYSLEEQRRIEILEFLSKKTEELNIESYCVVDDMELETQAKMDNCVLTDDMFGIDNSRPYEFIKKEIIEYLNKKL